MSSFFHLILTKKKKMKSVIGFNGIHPLLFFCFERNGFAKKKNNKADKNIKRKFLKFPIDVMQMKNFYVCSLSMKFITFKQDT